MHHSAGNQNKLSLNCLAFISLFSGKEYKSRLPMPTCVIYLGAFGPVTLGHVDLARRALRLFDPINAARRKLA